MLITERHLFECGIYWQGWRGRWAWQRQWQVGAVVHRLACGPLVLVLQRSRGQAYA